MFHLRNLCHIILINCKVIKKRIPKIIFRVIGGIFLLLFLLIGALQIPYIQTKATQKATKILSEKLKHPVTVQGVDISWLDTAILDDLCIQDEENDTLLYIQETYIDFQLLSLLSSKTVIDNVFLVNPKVQIIYKKEHESLNANRFIKLIMELVKEDHAELKEDEKDFQILTATLHNAAFEYFHPENDSIAHIDAKKQFNHYHFDIDKVFTHLENFHIADDTVAFQIIHLSAHEKNNDFVIKDFNTEFLYSKKCLEFQELDGYIQNSFLSEYIRFDYNHPRNFHNFIDSVKITANLDNTIISTKDLAYFAPSIAQYSDEWKLSGKVRGKVSNLKLRQFQVDFGKRGSHLYGNISFKGLPIIKETFLQINLEDSKIIPSDLEQYIAPKYYPTIALFGQIDFETTLIGYTTSFTTDGKFSTETGYIETDLQLDIKENKNDSYYEGELITKELDIGKLFNTSKFGLLDMVGDIHGKGFNMDNSVMNLNVDVQRIGFNNYDYQNISVITNEPQKKIFTGFKDKAFSFTGKTDIDDPNLKVDLNGSFTLNGNNSVFAIDTFSIPIAKLKPLNFIEDDLNIELENSFFNFKGLNVDSIEGGGFLWGTKVFYKEDSLILDNFSVNTTNDKIEETKTISVHSDYVDFTLNGNFLFKDAYDELRNTIKEFTSTLEEEEIKFISSKKHRSNHDIFYTFNFKNTTPVLQLFNKKSYISPESRVFGNFRYGKEHNFEVNALIDSFAYNNLAATNNTIFFDSHKGDEDDLLQANHNFTNETFYIDGKPVSENIDFEALWKNDRIRFSSYIEQYKRKNKASLMGILSLSKEKIGLHFDESEINLLQDTWHFDPNNVISFYKDSTSFKKFKIAFDKQEIGLEGSLGKDSIHHLSAIIDNFELQNLKPILGIDVEGQLSSKFAVENVKNTQSLNGITTIKNLVSQGIEIGDIKGEWFWNNSFKTLFSRATLRRNGRLTLNFSGSYNFHDPAQALNYTVTFERTPLGIIEEFAGEHLSDIEGYIDGNLHVTGSLANPSFNGSPMLHSKNLKINYLKTAYSFNHPIIFKNDSILFSNFILKDNKEQTKIRILGGIKHKLFSNFDNNIHLHLDKSLILNTKPNDNPLFYGRIFATGDVRLTGPFNDLKISSPELRTEKGSELYIPLDSEESISTKEYITFVKKPSEGVEKSISNKTKKLQKSIDSEVNLSGLLLDFNLFITPDTKFEIIFDEQAGEKIKANGNGNIQILVDTRGDFKMSGIYNINQGSYNFTLANFINKKFDISQNSKITWNGSPYDGTLDIQARYEQNASLLPLLEDDSSFVENNPTVRRAVKTAVLLNLDGSLLSPEISFGINIPTYPRYFEVEQAVQKLYSTINFNEQELNKQVFSLIVLKQFSTLDALNLNLGSTSASTVSELLSNQFSSWISQFDENLQIDIDLSGFDEETNNNFRVILRYNILDGKIRVTRDGNITNLNSNEQEQLANIFGEWTIEYLITDDGQIRMKAYNRAQNNLLNTGINNASMIVGTSLSHTADFDNLRELFKRNSNTKELSSLDSEEPRDRIAQPDSLLRPPIDTTKAPIK